MHTPPHRDARHRKRLISNRPVFCGIDLAARLTIRPIQGCERDARFAIPRGMQMPVRCRIDLKEKQ